MQFEIFLFQSPAFLEQRPDGLRQAAVSGGIGMDGVRFQGVIGEDDEKLKDPQQMCAGR